jgi:hypothetical protein
MISDSNGSDNEEYAVLSNINLPSFQKNILPPYQGQMVIRKFILQAVA